MKMKLPGLLRLERLAVPLHSRSRLLRRNNDRIHILPWVANSRYHHIQTRLFSIIPPTHNPLTRQSSFAKAATALVRAQCRPPYREKWLTIQHLFTVVLKSRAVRTWLQPLLPRVFIYGVPLIIQSSQTIHLTASIR